MGGQENHHNNSNNNNNNSQNDENNDENGNNNSQNSQRNNASMEPEQFRKVFIGGLSYKTDDDTLKAYFEKFGELVDHVVMKDGQTGRSRGFGFVTYSESFMVDELMKNRPHIIDGRQVEPKRATPREKDSGKAEVQMTVKKLFIGGLRDNISDDDLKAYFGSFGSVAEAIVMKEKETNKSRGFGFVTFDDYDPVDKIILQKVHTINGVNVHTQKALPKDGGNDGGRGGGGNFNGGGRGGNRGRNNNFGNDNYNNGGGFNNGGGGFNNGGGFRGNNGMGNDMPRFNDNGFNNMGGNSSMNSTYGSYNQAPNQPKMNTGMPMMGGNGGGYMGGGGNRGNNNGGPGPMRRGGGGFSNRSAGPYGGGGGGFQGNGGGRGGFQGNGNGRGGMGGRGGGGRGGMGGGRGGFNRGGGNQN